MKYITKEVTKLPLLPNWRHGKDEGGFVFYYHTIDRRTQWVPPVKEPHLLQESGASSKNRGKSSTNSSSSNSKIGGKNSNSAVSKVVAVKTETFMEAPIKCKAV